MVGGAEEVMLSLSKDKGGRKREGRVRRWNGEPKGRERKPESLHRMKAKIEPTEKSVASEESELNQRGRGEKGGREEGELGVESEARLRALFFATTSLSSTFGTSFFASSRAIYVRNH